MKQQIKVHKPTAILVVHNFGTLVDVSQLTEICNEYNVAIIEDAVRLLLWENLIR